MKTGRLDKAREALEAAKKADPNFFEPRELLTSFNDDPAAGSRKHLKRKHHKSSHPKKLSKAKKSIKPLSKKKKAISKK